MHGSTSPAEEGIAVALLRAASLPRHAVADEAHRAPCLGARGIETHFPQQRQDVHRGVPPAVPGRATPPAVGRLEGEQPRASALGGDPRALGRDLLGGRISQVPHHLPADRRVRVEQPVDDGHGPLVPRRTRRTRRTHRTRRTLQRYRSLPACGGTSTVVTVRSVARSIISTVPGSAADALDRHERVAIVGRDTTTPWTTLRFVGMRASSLPEAMSMTETD